MVIVPDFINNRRRLYMYEGKRWMKTERREENLHPKTRNILSLRAVERQAY